MIIESVAKDITKYLKEISSKSSKNCRKYEEYVCKIFDYI